MPDPLDRSDIRTGTVYEAVRTDERRSVAESQRERRVLLGDLLEVVFESRDSVRSALEEMLRSERLEERDDVDTAVAAFNEFVPGGGRLGATVYVRASDPAELAAHLSHLEGVRDTLFLDVGGVRIQGVALTGDVAAELAAGSYVVFELSGAQQNAWRSGAPVTLGSAHPAAAATVALNDSQRAAIASDL